MTDVDVVVVGARCAGAPLAALLARGGARVAVLERSTFPQDTLSSHTIQADALAFLDRLGVLDRVRATGARFTTRVDTRLEDYRFVADWPMRPGDPGGTANIRRHVLDPILADAAADAGADVRTGSRVVGLLRDRDRVAGVRVRSGGAEHDLRATLVVGADGRTSTVAALVGARAYHVTRNRRAYYWSFFENADAGPVPTFVFHRYADRFILGAPSDGGLHFVGVSPELGQLDAFKRDLEASFLAHATGCEPVAHAIRDARRATRIFGIGRFGGYFREAAGPGWVLAGDAGHFKDPAGGRGMGDSFLQVDALAPKLLGALGSPAELDRVTAEWGRWRDREFVPDHWMATDLGAAGPVPAVTPELVRRLVERRGSAEFLGLLAHRTSPAQVLAPGKVLGAAAALLRRPERGRMLRELPALVGEDLRRRKLARRPVHASVDAIADRHRDEEPAPA